MAAAGVLSTCTAGPGRVSADGARGPSAAARPDRPVLTRRGGSVWWWRWIRWAGGDPCGRRGQAVHHAHDEAPPGRDHGRLVELQPERVGRRHRRDDHLEPLERQRPGGQRGLRGPPRRQRRGPGLPRLPRGPELAGPEQFGDFLEGTADREAGGVQAAEAEAVAGDLGDGRLDRDARDPGGPPRPPPPGQSLDLVRAEQAGPAVRGLVPAEQAAADVGIECGGLDAEPPAKNSCSSASSIKADSSAGSVG